MKRKLSGSNRGPTRRALNSAAANGRPRAGNARALDALRLVEAWHALRAALARARDPREQLELARRARAVEHAIQAMHGR